MIRHTGCAREQMRAKSLVGKGNENRPFGRVN
jgi:hypothetical protein